MDCFDALEELLAAGDLLMEDLCQSGFDTVHDSTLGELKELGEAASQYGLAWLGEMLGKLAGELDMRRHRTEKEKDHIAGNYVRIMEYLYVCRQKVIYDRAGSYYEAEEEVDYVE